ncbi:hypothetical protein FRX31_010099 [Thalictrum thalictroides]|uniref:TF-B3 domain-containing protein n=1 Tax=Thalictrum thalictroides TaxID=46969 RepID=A0A7J6WTP2_THATH|nr:hypothetical protein FRX31_010099 [Thalictrum thalictroides]
MKVGTAEQAIRVQKFYALPENSKFRSLCLKYRAHEYLVKVGIMRNDEDFGPFFPFLLPNVATELQGQIEQHYTGLVASLGNIFIEETQGQSTGPSFDIESDEKAKWYDEFWKGVTAETQRKLLFDKNLCDTSVNTGLGAKFTIPKAHTVCFPALTPGDKGSVQIEDPTGKKWSITCTIDRITKSYLLRQGWTDFLKSHNLKVSDKLVFSIDRENNLYVNWVKASGESSRT